MAARPYDSFSSEWKKNRWERRRGPRVEFARVSDDSYVCLHIRHCQIYFCHHPHMVHELQGHKFDQICHISIEGLSLCIWTVFYYNNGNLYLSDVNGERRRAGPTYYDVIGSFIHTQFRPLKNARVLEPISAVLTIMPILWSKHIYEHFCHT